QCRTVLQGALAEKAYVHARAVPAYGAPPLPQVGHADFCGADGNFVIAGIHRLLVIAGYDANPMDGLEGKKTSAALDQFLKDRRLPAAAPDEANSFQVLLDAVKAADGLGFSWCNETPHAVMAALGIEEKGAITTRGWYR